MHTLVVIKFALSEPKIHKDTNDKLISDDFYRLADLAQKFRPTETVLFRVS